MPSVGGYGKIVTGKKSALCRERKGNKTMTDLFKDIPVVKYEGAKSKNPFAFKQYNPDELIGGKTMKEHLRFAMAYWHTMTATGMAKVMVAEAKRTPEQPAKRITA